MTICTFALFKVEKSRSLQVVNSFQKIRLSDNRLQQ